MRKYYWRIQEGGAINCLKSCGDNVKWKLSWRSQKIASKVLLHVKSNVNIQEGRDDVKHSCNKSEVWR